MAFFRQWLQKPVAIETAADLVDFLDGNAAFVAQRCLFEYARALAGYGWQPLMEEDGFRTAMERSRWLAYPIGLALVTEVVEGQLRLVVPGTAARVLAAMGDAARAAFDRHQPPPLIAPEAWRAAAERLEREVGALQSSPPLAVKDIAKPVADEMLGLVPIHPRLRGRDAFMVQNNLTVSLLKVHGDFAARADRQRVLADLVAKGDGQAAAG
jgi:uncharacterized protein YjeT (DUF2065 family)